MRRILIIKLHPGLTVHIRSVDSAMVSAQAQKDKAASESYEKRQMLWKGMAGRSWTELVQQGRATGAKRLMRNVPSTRPASAWRGYNFSRSSSN